MPRARGKDHKRQLLPAHVQTEYAQAVSDWLDRACPLYCEENVFKQGPGWAAHIDEAPQFEFCYGATHFLIRPLCPSEMLFQRKTHAAAQKELKRIACELMREAGAADARAWSRRFPARAGK